MIFCLHFPSPFSLPFLDAFSHLYKRVCPSVRRSVGPPVHRSVGPSVRQSHTSWNHAKVPFLTKTTISTSENVYPALLSKVRWIPGFCPPQNSMGWLDGELRRTQGLMDVRRLMWKVWSRKECKKYESVVTFLQNYSRLEKDFIFLFLRFAAKREVIKRWKVSWTEAMDDEKGLKWYFVSCWEMLHSLVLHRFLRNKRLPALSYNLWWVSLEILDDFETWDWGFPPLSNRSALWFRAA